MLIILFFISHSNFLFVPCGRLSWLPVSFLLHVKYPLSYRIYFRLLSLDSVLKFSLLRPLQFDCITDYFLYRAHEAACAAKKKEVDLYSAFIVVPHTQGAQVRITQCYLQITPYLPLPRKRSPDGASPD